MIYCKHCGYQFINSLEEQVHNCATGSQSAAMQDLAKRSQLGNYNQRHLEENYKLTSEKPVVEVKASKHDQTKPDLSLIPYISNVEHAKAFMVGEKKYGRYNYCKGHKASQLVAAIGRHSQAWFNGEETDPVDGQHHLGSVMACCSMLLRQMELGTMIDDRFKGAKNENDKK
jgi:hypothetical protein